MCADIKAPKSTTSRQQKLPGQSKCSGSSVWMGSTEMLGWSIGWGPIRGMPEDQIIPFSPTSQCDLRDGGREGVEEIQANG